MYKLKIKMSWLISRRLTLISALLDFLLSLLYFSKLDINSSSQNLTYLLIPISIFWLLVSYVYGRYSHQERSFPLIFLRNSLIFILAVALTNIFSFIYNLGLEYLFEYKINYFGDRISKLFFNFFITSFVVQTAINILTKKFFITNNFWLFLGDDLSFNKLKQYISCSKIEVNIDKIDKVDHKKFNSNDFRNLRGMILEDFGSISQKNLLELLLLKSKGFKVLSIFEWSEMILQKFPTELINSEKLITRSFISKKKSVEIRLKRIAELLISIFLIIITSPLLLFSAILIKLEDGGPILYSQIRTGFEGNNFKIYKLRTMRIDAEKGGVQWSKKNDSRVTKVGLFLRATRIDELPQLSSVIIGEMSLIGPRPERPEIEEILKVKIPYYSLRYLMRPGLSGWAQVNYPYGASIEDTKNKLSFDLYYLRNFSTFLDILILFKTLKVVFRASGSIPNPMRKELR